MITVTLTDQDIAGLRILLNTGDQLVREKLLTTCKKAAECGQQSVNVQEFTLWKEGNILAKNFIERAGI